VGVGVGVITLIHTHAHTNRHTHTHTRTQDALIRTNMFSTPMHTQACGVPVHLLKTQFRMHPDICR
jgi:hypothetical protein